MAPSADLEIKELQDSAKKTGDAVEVLTKSFDGLVKKLERTPAGTTADQVFGNPFARSGENSMTSRGFSFLKMMGVLTGQLEPEQAKVEIDVANRLHNIYVKELGTAGYTYAGGNRSRFLAPLSVDYMHENLVPLDFRRQMKSMVAAGSSSASPDEMAWIARKMMDAPGYRAKAMSWVNELTGGALVAPAEMGEIIELLRNREALINAGARTVPLPPQGRIKYPRQTSASTTYWIGENAPITTSQPGTGEVTLQAKKLAVLVQVPNELIRFASPAAEALLRDDMTKSLALGLDLAGLEGAGGDTRPRGVLNFQNINVVASNAPNANGDVVLGDDVYRMIAAVEESNAEFTGWIMRPKTWFKYLRLRGDAVAQGDSKGLFLFNPTRDVGFDGGKPMLGGYPVTKSTQVSQVRSKGTSSTLTYVLGGNWSELLIGMFGAIEFAQTNVGDTPFINDQTWVRGILTADIAARHEAAFAVLDNLDLSL